MWSTVAATGRFSFPTDIHFGPCAAAAKDAAALGRHALLIADAGVVRAGLADEVTAALAAAGVACTRFDGVGENPGEADVAAGAAALRDARADFLVAVGGGSVIDAAKLIRLAEHHPGPMAGYDARAGGEGRITGPLRPLVAVPTTAGTGSEVSRSAVVTGDDGRKHVVFSPRLLPTLAICDPALTRAMPARLTAATGADALTHAVEAYLARGFHPMADALALQAVTYAFRHLRRAVIDGQDGEARAHMMLASMFGAVAFQKGLGVCHAMAHALTAVHGLHHGLANAICLPAVVAFNAQAAPDRVRELDRAAGNGLGLLSNGDAAAHFLFELQALLDEAGLPRSLRAAGVEAPDTARLVTYAMDDGCRLDNARDAGPEELRALFAEVA